MEKSSMPFLLTLDFSPYLLQKRQVSCPWEGSTVVVGALRVKMAVWEDAEFTFPHN